MELLLLLEGISQQSPGFPIMLGKEYAETAWGKKLSQGFKAQKALEKKIVSHIHLLINFYERLSPALNPQEFITKKNLDWTRG